MAEDDKEQQRRYEDAKRLRLALRRGGRQEAADPVPEGYEPRRVTPGVPPPPEAPEAPEPQPPRGDTRMSPNGDPSTTSGPTTAQLSTVPDDTRGTAPMRISPGESRNAAEAANNASAEWQRVGEPLPVDSLPKAPGHGDPGRMPQPTARYDSQGRLIGPPVWSIKDHPVLNWIANDLTDTPQDEAPDTAAPPEQAPQVDGSRGISTNDGTGQPPPPAGPPPVTTTTIPEHEQEKMAKWRINDIYNRGQDVAGGPGQIADAEANRFDVMADRQQQAADALARQTAEAQAAADQKNELVRQEQDDLQERAQAATDGKVDPEHFWGSRSVPQKIMSVIALALGGFSAGLTGGPNPAMGFLQKAIDNDIAGQEANLKSRESGIHQQRGLLADKVKTLGDEAAAKSATRQAYLQAAMMQVEALGMKANGPIQKARAEDMKNQILKSLAEERASFYNLIPQQTVTSGGAGAGKPPEAWDYAKTLQENNIPTEGRMIDQLSSMLAGGAEGISRTNNILSNVPGYDSLVLSDKARANRNLVALNAGQLARSLGGRLNENSQALAKKIESGSGTPQEIQEFVRDVSAAWNDKVRNLNAGVDQNKLAAYSENGGAPIIRPKTDAEAFPGSKVGEGPATTRDRPADRPPVPPLAPSHNVNEGKGKGGGGKPAKPEKASPYLSPRGQHSRKPSM